MHILQSIPGHLKMLQILQVGENIRHAIKLCTVELEPCGLCHLLHLVGEAVTLTYVNSIIIIYV